MVVLSCCFGTLMIITVKRSLVPFVVSRREDENAQRATRLRKLLDTAKHFDLVDAKKLPEKPPQPITRPDSSTEGDCSNVPLPTLTSTGMPTASSTRTSDLDTASYRRCHEDDWYTMGMCHTLRMDETFDIHDGGTTQPAAHIYPDQFSDCQPDTAPETLQDTVPDDDLGATTQPGEDAGDQQATGLIINLD